MTQALSWTFAGGTPPCDITVSGTGSAAVLHRATASVAPATSITLELGLSDFSKLRFLHISASSYANVEISTDSGISAPFAGPMLVSGDLARLLGATRNNPLFVTNNGAADVTIDLLVYSDA
jgi:hypothetical protein